MALQQVVSEDCTQGLSFLRQRQILRQWEGGGLERFSSVTGRLALANFKIAVPRQKPKTQPHFPPASCSGVKTLKPGCLNFYLNIFFCEQCQKGRKLAVDRNLFNENKPFIENT